MVNRRSRLLLSQRSSQAQGKAQEPRSSRTRVLTRKATLKVRRGRPCSAKKFLETTKGLQFLQEMERRTVGGTGDDEEEPGNSDSDNDQHSCQNAR